MGLGQSTANMAKPLLTSGRVTEKVKSKNIWKLKKREMINSDTARFDFVSTNFVVKNIGT